MRRSFTLHCILALILTVSLAMNVNATGSVSSVNVANQKVELMASAGVEQIRYFTLDSPKRLVVDLYGVQPGKHGRNFSLKNGFRSLRVGPYEDKTRFVFDVAGTVFPTFNVNTENDQVVVVWQDTVAANKQAAREIATIGSAQVTSIDFSSQAGKSRIDILLKGASVVTGPEKEGNKVQFSLNNATIPRSLRRSFDTLAFPSAIHSVTPYLVNIGGTPQVRFNVNLKGDVKYQLQKTAKGYAFIVNDGNYSKSQPALTGVFPIPTTGKSIEADGRPKQVDTAPVESLGRASNNVTDSVTGSDSKYTGDKTSLVFDNADVRDILRLIAEMSDLNIIASDEVKGNVTLRLIDVPWDQALDLILDISGLGMLREGNIVRVLPKGKIRTMRETELSAARSQEKLEPLVTEVVTVSYADLGSIAGPTKETLSERGNLTEDSRNKLLIITDVPSRIAKAKDLIKILDTPERQVMIEARIVQVASNYSRDLGINWGLQSRTTDPNSFIEQGVASLGGGFLIDPVNEAVGSFVANPGLGTQMRFGQAIFDNVILDLQISALESEGKGKVISTPRVTTLNGQTAKISQGTTIPYQTSGADGPKTEFVNAELKLEVIPVINPDNTIILEVIASNDTPGAFVPGSGLSIDTKTAETKVLIKDGETTVIGGIFVENQAEGVTGVPWLMHIPLLGQLFKSTAIQTTKDELLIFITPRILHDN